MNAAINIENVVYKYPKSQAPVLKGVSFSIEPGTFSVILGPTGAGKTTLAMCLNGLIPQLLEGSLSGSVNVKNANVAKVRVQRMSEILGLVLQDPETQIFGRTVEEDTAFGLRNFLVPKEEIDERIDAALKSVGLADFRLRETSQMSGGEKQRLAVAGVLAMQPEILVLDEPTSELDPLGREQIYSTIENLRRTQALTILAIEHSSEEIACRADEILIVHEGKLVWQGAPRTLFSNSPLVEQYGIKPLQVASIGWKLQQLGLLTAEQIPLTVTEAKEQIEKILPVSPKNTQTKPVVKEQAAHKSASPVVSIQNLSHTYPNKNTALRGLSLDIYPGEFVAIIGQNGAGKTTLAKHLNGLLQPTQGTVLLGGNEVSSLKPDQIAQEIGYVFQNPDHQIFSATVEQEIAYGLNMAKLPAATISERIDKVLEITNLTKQRAAHPFSLGRGERQMVAVASILALEPKLLVVDEPTTGQDWRGINRIMELITSLQQQGTTILMITHDMDLVARYAQRVLVMKEGELLLDDTPQYVFAQHEILAQTYIQPPQVTRLGQLLGFAETMLTEEQFIDEICTRTGVKLQ